MFAPTGTMPEVLEAGPDFLDMGLPYLKEQYVHGRNRRGADQDEPEHWGYFV